MKMKPVFLKIIVFLFLVYSSYSSFAQEDKQPTITYLSINPLRIADNELTIIFTGIDSSIITHYKTSRRWPDEIGQWNYQTLPDRFNFPIEADNSYIKNIVFDDVNLDSVSLSVAAFEKVGDVDLVVGARSKSHCTIFLEGEIDLCNASLFLKWNEYSAFHDNTLEYRIRVERENGSIETLGSVGGNIEEVQLNWPLPNENDRFFITAFHNDPSLDSVNSIGISLDVTDNVYPENIYADYGTVNEEGHPEIQFTMQDESENVRYVLYRSDSPDIMGDSIYSEVPENGGIFRFTDNAVDATEQPFYYTLAALNGCNFPIIFSDNLAGTIHLNNTTINNKQVPLSWTEYINWLNGVQEYRIERGSPGGYFEVVGYTSDPSFTDDITNISSEIIRYRITAIKAIGELRQEAASSISNIIEVIQEVELGLDYDAFMPESASHNGFGPELDIIVSDFEFTVYNRSGSIVYQSTDPSPDKCRWNGKYLNTGSYVPQGLYRYVITINKQIIKKGKVTVVRN